MRPESELTNSDYITIKSRQLKKYPRLIDGLENVKKSYDPKVPIPDTVSNALNHLRRVIKESSQINLDEVNAAFGALYTIIFTKPLDLKKCEILGKAVLITNQIDHPKGWIGKLQDWFLDLVNVTNQGINQEFSNCFTWLQQDPHTSDALPRPYAVNQTIKTAIDQGLFQYRKQKYPHYSNLKLSSGKFGEVEKSSKSHKIWRELFESIERNPCGFHQPCLVKAFSDCRASKTSAKTFILSELLGDRPTNQSIKQWVSQQHKGEGWVVKQWQQWCKENYQFEQFFTQPDTLRQSMNSKVKKQSCGQQQPNSAGSGECLNELITKSLPETLQVQADHELNCSTDKLTDLSKKIKTFHDEYKKIELSPCNEGYKIQNAKELLSESQTLSSKPNCCTKASSDVQQKFRESTLELKQNQQQLFSLIINKCSHAVIKWQEDVKKIDKDTDIFLKQLQQLEDVYRQLCNWGFTKKICDSTQLKEYNQQCEKIRDLLKQQCNNYYRTFVQPEINDRITFLQQNLKTIDAIVKVPSVYRNQAAQQALEDARVELNGKIDAYKLMCLNDQSIFLSTHSIEGRLDSLSKYDEQIKQFCEQKIDQLKNTRSWGREVTDKIRTALRKILSFFNRLRTSGNRIQPQSRHTKTTTTLSSTAKFFDEHRQKTCASEVLQQQPLSGNGQRAFLQVGCG